MNIRGSSTGIRGVHFKAGKFRAVGYANRVPIYLGTFDRITEAKKAYDEWKSLPKPNVRQEMRYSDHHKEERASPEMYGLVYEALFHCYEDSGEQEVNAAYLKAKDEYR